VAILYRAQLTPTKIELLSAWVPFQSWYRASTGPRTLDAAGAYRFDDPEGEVGIETFLLRSANGQVFQVPLTYRDAAIDGAEAALVGTTQHSVLGERWVYDACGDPVYAQALASAILSGGTEAELEVETDEGRERRETTTKVAGSGLPGSRVPQVGPVTYLNEATTTIVRTGDLELTVLRLIDVSTEAARTPGIFVLTGTWPGQAKPAHLASARITPAG
jgi:hypothetical protein